MAKIQPSSGPGTPTRRALRMAAMGAGVAGSYVGYLMQRAFLDPEQRKTKLAAAHTRAGRVMRDEMLSLKGPAMKLGQTLSLQTGLLPDGALAELASLQMKAPGMHPSLVRAQFHVSMNRYPEELFAAFDPEPFAAASLGQVHKATTREGRRVAVKIQYPGIRDAVANDFTWFRAVSKPAQATGHLPKRAIDELESEIMAETDYAREAANAELLRDRLRPLAFVTIPEILREYSSDKVLTMTLLPGRHLDAFLSSRPSQKLRDTVGAHLFELFYFQMMRVGALHADPHWGNYLINADGSIGLVDFGCVKHFQPAFIENLRSLYLYPGSRNSVDFQRRLEQRYSDVGEKLSPATRRALVAFSENFYRLVYPPERDKDDQAFDFGDASFLHAYVRASQTLTKSKGVLPEHIFMVRAEIGLYNTLHKLQARVHTSRIVRQFLDQS